MKRAAIEKPRTVHTWRNHVATHHGQLICDCELQPGRFRKSQRIGGCGRPRCWLCHPDKLAGRPTIQQRRFLAKQLEGLAESGEADGAAHPDAREAFHLFSPSQSRAGDRER